MSIKHDLIRIHDVPVSLEQIFRRASMAIFSSRLCSGASFICAASAFLANPSPVSAQCGPTGCTTAAPQVGLPAITRPTAAQSVAMASRIAALEARMNQMTAVSSPSGSPSFRDDSSTKSASKAFLAAMNTRTWINGEGLWQMSPSGATCQLSSVVSTLNSSPCSSSF